MHYVRHITMLVITVVSLCLMSCSTPKPAAGYDRTGEVVCVDHDNETTTLHVKAQGNSSEEAQYNADIKAFDNLLYKGVPKSNQSDALIESQNKDNVEDKVADFFQSGDYRHYIVESSLLRQNTSSGTYFVDQKIIIHLSALRKHLEDKNIIRKFGI